ncbi:hypothetical protein HY490_00630 [Candidatus Woesearchaeota archaeon]|nr:hypothetical protein [Candidatus Woesearchaeota archaeon]
MEKEGVIKFSTLILDVLRVLPSRDSVEYGTPAIVDEVSRLFRESSVRDTGFFVMGGHE